MDALTLRHAVFIAAVLEFSGAFFLGSNVSSTLQTGIVDLTAFASQPTAVVLGMISALLATSIWLQIASFFGWPVSTTHAIVGAILGFGLMIGGVGAIQWSEIINISSSWVISPLLSGIFSYILFRLVQKAVFRSMNPIRATKRIFPYLTTMVLLVFLLGAGEDTAAKLSLNLSSNQLYLIGGVTGIICFALSKVAVSRMKALKNLPPIPGTKGLVQLHSLSRSLKHLHRLRLITSGEDKALITKSIEELKALLKKLEVKTKKVRESAYDYRVVENLFSYLQILSACLVAFAHGANDVANAIGPVASVLSIIRNPQNFNLTSTIPSWLLAMGGVGIVIGLATWGWRVIETIGRKITELTPSRGFCAEFGAATTILLASNLGLPISTTHCIVGSVLGIGMAKGISGINLAMIREIFLSWVITIPSSAITAILLYQILSAFFGNTSLL